MSFDDGRHDDHNDLKILRINIATKLCQGLLAHHGSYGTLEEFVGDAYEMVNEILRQGNPKFMNRETEEKSWRREPNFNSHHYKNYGDNVI